MIQHNNFNHTHKYPFGAVATGSTVSLSIQTDRSYRSCLLRIWTPERQEIIIAMTYQDGAYHATYTPNTVGLHWYLFIIQDHDYQLHYYGTQPGFTAGHGQLHVEYPAQHAFQITCYRAGFEVPSWYQGETMYQIFPDRFAKSEEHRFDTRKYGKIHTDWNTPLGCTQWGADNFEFYGGNILGIIEKLPYLESLKIGTIYLNPIFLARSNHRYDAASFTQIDEMLGYESDFKQLCSEAHKRNMRIIIDVSWNHVGDDSIYFNRYRTYGADGAYQNANSRYRNWFNIHPNGTYDSWWGFDSLPVINKHSGSYRTHVSEAIHYWSSLGIDGFRLDVIDELPDDFLEWFYGAVKQENPELVIFGEVWDEATLKQDSNGFRSYLLGHSQDSTMHYPLRNLLVDFICFGRNEKEIAHESCCSARFAHRYLNMMSNYPKDAFYSTMNFLSTHDINRITTVFADTEPVETLSKSEQGLHQLSQDERTKAFKRFQMAWLALICLPGNPSLFYGDEIGMDGFNDPYNRKPFPWSEMDIAWCNWTTWANTFRQTHDFLRTAPVLFQPSPRDVVAFTRQTDEDCLYYAFNRSARIQFIEHEEVDYVIEPYGWVLIHNGDVLTSEN